MSLVIVEGNISAGKSTLCRDLANILNYDLYLEPALSNPYLARFYQDPKKYALRMQLWLLRQRFRVYLDALKQITLTGRGVILDRSVYSDWVFAERNRLDGNISEDGFKGYTELRSKMLSCIPMPDVMVHLDVSAKECYRRVRQLRCRDVEMGIPLEYLAGLGDCYQAFCKEMQDKGVAVYNIGWDSFGNSKKVASLIAQHTHTPNPALLEFLNDEEEIKGTMFIDMKLFEKDWEDDEEETAEGFNLKPDEEGQGNSASMRGEEGTSCMETPSSSGPPAVTVKQN